jgi:hypothetical protein
MRFRSICAAVLTVVAAAGAQAAVGYKVLDLGANLYANDVNNLGQVVGWGGPIGNQSGFEWSPTSGMQWFGAGTVASALNDRGQVVLNSAIPDPTDEFNWIGVTTVRNPDGTTTQLPNLSSFYNAGVSGASINNMGQVTGTATQHFGNQDTNVQGGFLWTPGKGMVALTGGTSPDSYGLKVNGAGQVLGYTNMHDDWGMPLATTPFLRTASGQNLDMGLPIVDQQGWGGIRNARGLNDWGTVAGYVSAEPGSQSFPDGGDYAYVWSHRGGLQFIGGQGTEAVGINDFGLVIGGSGGKAALWSKSGGWQDLGSLLSPEDAAKLGTLSWWDMTDVNNLGMILANVSIDGVNHAILFEPEWRSAIAAAPVPEPGTWALSLVGLAGLGALTFRSRRRKGA